MNFLVGQKEHLYNILVLKNKLKIKEIENPNSIFFSKLIARIKSKREKSPNGYGTRGILEFET